MILGMLLNGEGTEKLMGFYCNAKATENNPGRNAQAQGTSITGESVRELANDKQDHSDPADIVSPS